MRKFRAQSLLSLLAALSLLGSGCRAIRGIGQSKDSIAARRISRQGIQAMRSGNWNTAEKLFEAALAESKSDDRAHRGLAESLWQRNNNEEAIKHMEQAVRLSAGEPKMIERLGRMYLEVGRLDDANLQCQRALQADRESAAIWALRGDCLFQRKQLDDALAAYHRALALQPDYHEVQMQAAEIYRQQGRFDRLLATLDRLRESSVDDQVPYRVDILRGVAMRQLQQGKEARRCFQTAAIKDPSAAEPHLMIASLCLDDDDVPAARTAVEHAMQLDPEAVREGKWMEQLENHQRRLSQSPNESPSQLR